MNAWSSEHIAALTQLATAVPEQTIVVIGAVAVGHHLGIEFRATRDLDLCVATSLQALQLPSTWVKLATPAHRWRTERGLPIDLLPVDDASLRRGNIHWPDGTRLELAGIDLALRDAQPAGRGLPSEVRVASLRALFVCKAIAWTDRPGDRRKDLGDLAQILDRYVDLDDPRCFEESALPVDLDIEERPAFLLGLDLASCCTTDHLRRLTEFLGQVRDMDRAPYAVMATRWPRDYHALRRRLDALRLGLAAGHRH